MPPSEQLTDTGEEEQQQQQQQSEEEEENSSDLLRAVQLDHTYSERALRATMPPKFRCRDPPGVLNQDHCQRVGPPQSNEQNDDEEQADEKKAKKTKKDARRDNKKPRSLRELVERLREEDRFFSFRAFDLHRQDEDDDDEDEEEDEEPVIRLRRRKRRPANPFIDTEAILSGEDEGDDDGDDESSEEEAEREDDDVQMQQDEDDDDGEEEEANRRVLLQMELRENIIKAREKEEAEKRDAEEEEADIAGGVSPSSSSSLSTVSSESSVALKRSKRRRIKPVILSSSSEGETEDNAEGSQQQHYAPPPLRPRGPAAKRRRLQFLDSSDEEEEKEDHEEEDDDELVFTRYKDYETDFEERKHRARAAQHRTRVEQNALCQFMQFLFDLPDRAEFSLLAHCGRFFDFHFLVQYLVERGISFNPMYDGNKLLGCHIKSLNIFLKDFHCFAPNSLAQVAKSYGLGGQLDKGFFPYRLIQPQYYGLELSHLPHKEDYEPSKMTQKRREEFDVWYDENEDKYNSTNKYKLNDQLLFYNYNDTFVLLGCVLLFIKSSIELEGRVQVACHAPKHYTPGKNHVRFEVDPTDKRYTEDNCGILYRYPRVVHPFSKEFVTVSSYVNALFRKYCIGHGPGKTPDLPVIHDQRASDPWARTSFLERMYFSFLREHRPSVKCHDNGGAQIKFNVGPHQYHVDGFEEETGLVR